MRTTPPPPASRQDDGVQELLDHFELLESQLHNVRQGLTHSHRLATLGTISSIIAHEYNNILTPIISYAQLALASPEDPKLMRKAVERALDGARRAASISSSLLGFAREQDQDRAADLRTVAREAVTCLGREPKKDGIGLWMDLPEVRVAMGPLGLQQVLLNLLLNARKAMRQGGGELRLTARCEKGLVTLEVSDTGPGIPPQVLDRLFEPFVTHRINDGEEPAGPRGTGLGLCICRELLESAGGRITAVSRPGRGASFYLTIPRAVEAAAADQPSA